ncbi:MAG: 3-oxoacyl-ACP reductase [Chloroflexi bacterium RBG_16_57_8]|nr:MAG: 3-oxoacyl-ACP reductase [Chloroflexi bacterium RBG_16_57_8]
MSSHSKVAVITGAGSGIGKATALAFLNDGYRVALAGRRQQALEDAIKGAGTNASRAIAVPTDVRDEASVRDLFSRARDQFGRIDVVFTNAGVFAPAVALEDITVDQWKAVVDANLTGMFLCIREAFRVMKDQDPQGGRIINNGSVSAHAPRPDSAPYTATKHGVTGLTKSASLDGRKYGIACCQIDIGNATTEHTARISRGVLQADGSIKPEAMMNVQEVASAVLYMASLPLDTNVQFMTIMATKMPFIGRG